MTDSFRTIDHPGKGIYKEKMSKFISFALPVSDKEEAKEIIRKYQNEYHDARHVCWAYMLGPERVEWQLNDNGEPSGTAGKPILGQINSFGLSDVIVVVVRYFGGIKLGTSGLISAYREAAKIALEDAGETEKIVKDTINIRFPFIAMNGVMNLIKKSGAKIEKQEFDNSCFIKLSIRKGESEKLKNFLAELDGVIII